MGGWMVTRRDLVVAMMRDPQTFTVDDPRFSTGQVVGPSMLSLDGPEHDRHRQPFANHFRATGVRRALVDAVSARAQALVGVMRNGVRERSEPISLHPLPLVWWQSLWVWWMPTR